MLLPHTSIQITQYFVATLSNSTRIIRRSAFRPYRTTSIAIFADFEHLWTLHTSTMLLQYEFDVHCIKFPQPLVATTYTSNNLNFQLLLVTIWVTAMYRLGFTKYFMCATIRCYIFRTLPWLHTTLSNAIINACSQHDTVTAISMYKQAANDLQPLTPSGWYFCYSEIIDLKKILLRILMNL